MNFISSPFLNTLATEVPLDSIPVSLGGNYQGWNTPFEFDQSEDGLLAYPHRSYPFHNAKESSEESKGNENENQTETTTLATTETTETTTTTTINTTEATEIVEKSDDVRAPVQNAVE